MIVYQCFVTAFFFLGQEFVFSRFSVTSSPWGIENIEASEGTNDKCCNMSDNLFHWRTTLNKKDQNGGESMIGRYSMNNKYNWWRGITSDCGITGKASCQVVPSLIPPPLHEEQHILLCFIPSVSHSIFPPCYNKQDIAAATAEESERLFTELIRSITCSQAVMKVLIQSQEQAERERIKELMKQVEDDISELKKSDAEMEQLLSTQNDIQFLQVTWLVVHTNILHRASRRSWELGYWLLDCWHTHSRIK